MQTLLKLKEHIRNLKKVVVAFSGGVDSALLAYLSRTVLGREKAIAVTGDSMSVPSRDRTFVREFCKRYDIEHRFIKTREFENPNYKSNPANRCFFCKEELYTCLKDFARTFGTSYVLDGTNTTDLKGSRPGFEALKKFEIVAPYVLLGIDKQAIRKMAKELRLEVATKPQAACLASRIPTGTPIDIEALKRVDAAENFLKDLGVKQPRVRFHGELARLELKQKEWDLCLKNREIIISALNALGFQRVTLDLKPYEREG